MSDMCKIKIFNYNNYNIFSPLLQIRLCFVFARGVDLNIVLTDTCNQYLCVPLYIPMILIFILQETDGIL